MRYAIIVVVGLCLTTTAHAELRFDPQQGVRGRTEEKRDWLAELIRDQVQGERQLQMLQQLDNLNPRAISRLANAAYWYQLRELLAQQGWQNQLRIQTAINQDSFLRPCTET